MKRKTQKYKINGEEFVGTNYELVRFGEPDWTTYKEFQNRRISGKDSLKCLDM